MNRRTWITALVLTAIGSLSFFVYRPAGLGYLLGCLTAILLYKRNEWFWTGVLDQRSATQWTGFLHFIVNYLMMGGVLVLSALYPQYLNIFACAIGLFLIKITVTIDVLIHREGE